MNLFSNELMGLKRWHDQSHSHIIKKSKNIVYKNLFFWTLKRGLKIDCYVLNALYVWDAFLCKWIFRIFRLGKCNNLSRKNYNTCGNFLYYLLEDINTLEGSIALAGRHYYTCVFSGGSRPLQTGMQIASLVCQCCVLVYHIVVSLYVWGHPDLPDRHHRGKNFFCYKGKSLAAAGEIFSVMWEESKWG